MCISCLLLQLLEEEDTIGLDGNLEHRAVFMETARVARHMVDFSDKDLSMREGDGEITDNPAFRRLVDSVATQLQRKTYPEAVTVGFLVSR